MKLFEMLDRGRSDMIDRTPPDRLLAYLETHRPEYLEVVLECGAETASGILAGMTMLLQILRESGEIPDDLDDVFKER